jgi:hypothetical protein
VGFEAWDETTPVEALLSLKGIMKTKKKRTLFSELRVGDHFLYGQTEHVCLPTVEVPGGYFNAAQIGNGRTSGFGPKVEVTTM